MTSQYSSASLNQVCWYQQSADVLELRRSADHDAVVCQVRRKKGHVGTWRSNYWCWTVSAVGRLVASWDRTIPVWGVGYISCCGILYSLQLGTNKTDLKVWMKVNFKASWCYYPSRWCCQRPDVCVSDRQARRNDINSSTAVLNSQSNFWQWTTVVSVVESDRVIAVRQKATTVHDLSLCEAAVPTLGACNLLIADLKVADGYQGRYQGFTRLTISTSCCQ